MGARVTRRRRRTGRGARGITEGGFPFRQSSFLSPFREQFDFPDYGQLPICQGKFAAFGEEADHSKGMRFSYLLH